MLSLALVVDVEFRKNGTMGTRGRSSTSSAVAAVLLYRSLCYIRNRYAQEQPAVGAVVGHIEPLEVLGVAMPEQVRTLVVRVELGGREEQEVDPWTGSGAPEVQFSPRSRRASSG